VKDISRRLRTRREELGLSLAEVQAETKIRRKYLEALEAGDDAALPGEVYLKGFLRFYGEFLGLDGWALVREYREAKVGGKSGPAAEQTDAGPGRAPAGAAKAPARPAQGASRQAPPPLETRSPVRAGGPGRVSVPRAGRVSRVLVYALAVLVVVTGAGLWYVWSQGDAPTAGEGPGGSPAPGGDQVPGAGSPAGDGASPGEDGSPGGGAGEGGPGGETPDGGSGPGEETPSEEPSADWAIVSESAVEVSYVVYGAPFTVAIETTERCWVKVSVDGRAVLEETLEAGETGWWTADEEVFLRLGRPQVVTVSLDGEVLGPGGVEDAPRNLVFRAGPTPGGE